MAEIRDEHCRRASELFDIIIDYPKSKPALEDLTVRLRRFERDFLSTWLMMFTQSRYSCKGLAGD
jgi:hypothetical protein